MDQREDDERKEKALGAAALDHRDAVDPCVEVNDVEDNRHQVGDHVV